MGGRSRSGRVRRLALAVVVGTLLVLSLEGRALAGPKVDRVVLGNGNELTCEIKGLTRGRLSIGTDALDTVSVYWEQVLRLASPRTFEVETRNGSRHFGRLEDVAERRIRVTPATGAGVEFPLDDVVALTPIEATFWRRLDGHVDLGFSFAKANLETRWTLNAESAYHARKYRATATLASQFTRREDADRLSRNTLTMSGLRLVGQHWFTLALAQVQTNQELSLDSRVVVGAGVGRILVQSNASNLRAYVGVVHTREKFSGVSPQSSPEAAVGADWNWFSARNDTLDLTTAAVSYYNIAGDARARVEAQSALRVEFLSDFYFSVNAYYSYDSTPPQDRTSNDSGVSLSLGWKF